MHSLSLLPFIAGFAAAFNYVEPEASAASAPRRTLLRRQNHIPPIGSLPNNAYTVYQCPSSTQTTPDAITFEPLNTTDLGNAQQQMVQWAANNGQLPPSTGGPGTQMTSGGVTVLLCNMDTVNMKMDPGVIAHLFDQIWCGDINSPTQGYGQLKYNGNEYPERYYTYYGPAGHVGSCMSQSDYYNTGVQSQSCTNAANPNKCNQNPGDLGPVPEGTP